MTIVEQNVISEAADRLSSAGATRTPCAPVRDLIGSADLDAAYRVQARNIGARLTAGRTVAGRKIGLTSRAVQTQFGVDQPDFGVLLDDFDVSADAVIDLGRLMQPRIEPEIALVLSADISEPVSATQAPQFVSQVCASFEILDSRIASWDISVADSIADNASSGLYVLGDAVRPVDTNGLVDTAVVMTEDGERVFGEYGWDAFESPWSALSWIARTSLEHGSRLRSGDVILTGSLGPVVTVNPGSTYTAEIAGIGRVTATFG
ncbi:2-keto-4-pentenoate hydratase [Rhodococcus sp. 14-2470-1b]|jgi:2-keto-4-pentenoate hydratase|uniref:2-keto-4-pentenoate hydratase n=1 Tax=unclassified Rhodococcus (in: high G+C Gram-positive bacteria) TaxID=192944 RepID=UPI000B9AF4AB|nr:fumarylacetoacetate hydrolase family protein [Rhodococcus sp. 14-2470-1b]OZF53016.1 2-keto-4-pentenoate hydratase [Rhodococcus sp. 14-2470-1b]